MKPLVTLVSTFVLMAATSVYAECNKQSLNSCYPKAREHITKVHYKEPVIFCEYHRDDVGKPYRICNSCDYKKCVKEYFFDGYCG